MKKLMITVFSLGASKSGLGCLTWECAFAAAGMDWRKYVEVDPRYFRPVEVDYLLADPAKARDRLGWTPSVPFDELVRLMVEADVAEIEQKLRGGVEALRLAVGAEARVA